MVDKAKLLAALQKARAAQAAKKSAPAAPAGPMSVPPMMAGPMKKGTNGTQAPC